MGQFQFAWCSGGSIVAITPQIYLTVVFRTRFATFVASLSFCYQQKLLKLVKMAILQLQKQAISSPVHKWIRHLQSDSVFQRSINYRFLHVTIVACKSRLNFYPRNALLAWFFLRQHVCPSVTADIVSKWIKISSSFFLGLVAPPHRFSNSTHDCEILKGRGACHLGGLA